MSGFKFNATELPPCISHFFSFVVVHCGGLAAHLAPGICVCDTSVRHALWVWTSPCGAPYPSITCPWGAP